MERLFPVRNASIWVFWAALILCSCGCTKAKNEKTEKYEYASPPETTGMDQRPAIVALGDSLTAGQGVDPSLNYPSMLQRKIDEAGYSYRVLNYGVSGDTSGQGLTRLESILTTKPSIVIIELGANDGLRGIPAEVTKQNLAAIVQRLQSSGARIVLAGMQVPPNYGPQYTVAFRGIFGDIAKEYRVALVPFFLEGVGGKAELNQEDGIHPNAEGYKVIVENVWKTIRPLL